jgi:hypothetical protein
MRERGPKYEAMGETRLFYEPSPNDVNASEILGDDSEMFLILISGGPVVQDRARRESIALSNRWHVGPHWASRVHRQRYNDAPHRSELTCFG